MSLKRAEVGTHISCVHCSYVCWCVWKVSVYKWTTASTRSADACTIDQPHSKDSLNQIVHLNCTDPIQLLNFTASLQLDNVTHVYVKCDSLFRLPSNITVPSQLRLNKLKVLRIRGCGIEAVNLLKNLKHTGHLTELDLTNNNLTDFKWQLARQFNAQRLILTWVIALVIK